MNSNRLINGKHFIYIFNCLSINLLKELICEVIDNEKIIINDNNLILLLSDKEFIEVKEYLGAMSEDIGCRISVIKLLKVSTNEDLNLLYQLVIDANILKNDYSSLSDLVLYYHNDEKIKKIIKELIIKACASDEIFKIAKAMFSENLNVSKAANKLYMHRNTLNNKLDYLEKNSGLSLREFKDCIALYELMK